MGNAIIEEEDFEVSVGISVPELELDGVVEEHERLFLVWNQSHDYQPLADQHL